jgi:hypothetical protein
MKDPSERLNWPKKGFKPPAREELVFATCEYVYRWKYVDNPERVCGRRIVLVRDPNGGDYWQHTGKNPPGHNGVKNCAHETSGARPKSLLNYGGRCVVCGVQVLCRTCSKPMPCPKHPLESGSWALVNTKYQEVPE